MENVKRRPTLRIPAKASVWYIGSSATARLIGALGTPIFTRLLTPEEYGVYPLYNTWLGIFTVAVTAELTGAAIYRGLQRHADDTDGFVSAVMGLILTLFGIFSLLFAILREPLGRLTGLGGSLTALMLVQILGTATISLYTARARFEYRYKTVAMMNILTAALIPLLALAIIYTTRIRAEARIIASALSACVIAAPILIKTARGRLIAPKTWRYLLGRSLPLLPHYLGMTAILKIGEISVSRLYGAAALGKYSVALSVGLALTVITSGVMSALSPWLIRRVRCGELERVRELLLILTRIISVSCLLLLAIAPEAMAIFSSGAYHAALPAVYPVALSVIPTFLSGALMSGLVYYERSALSSVPAVIAACVSAVLTLTLLPYTDYRYAALFSLVAYITLAVMNVLVFTKTAGKSPVAVRSTLTTFILSCGYAALLYALRDALPVRILLAIPPAVLLLYVSKEAYERIKE